MDGFSVRTADSGAADRLVRLVGRYHSEISQPLSSEQVQLLLEIVEDPAWGRAWLAAAEQRDVGYATAYYYCSFQAGGRMGLVGEVYVAPEYRHRGIGRTLLTRVLSEVAAAGCKGVAMRSDLENEGERTFLASLGFLPLKQPNDIMVLGFDRRSPLT
jgi:GNAT superfamily N-acetyltransferase